ncbi:heterokaryon incompatibility protein-domain-containing protein [Xylaria longipes]|nr:heterokaryon incompatibility protein-domain-containing protein [Xylaria longipes]
MLGSEFRGIGVRGLADEVDRAVPYDALSYTWGNGETTQVIQCNGIDFPITENLFHALRALRASQDQGQDRYLWVDAICINQIDNKDKAMQVRNMFQIFKRATKVIAWLGKTFEGFESVCNEASALEKTLDSGESLSALEPESNFWDVYNGMFQLYTRPWFKRIWIQQEIFAAEDLRLQCGMNQFSWFTLLSKPMLLLYHYHLESYYQLNEQLKKAKDTANHAKLSSSNRISLVPNSLLLKYRSLTALLQSKKLEKLEAKVPPDIAAKVEAISTLHELHIVHINCFERYSSEKTPQPDFVEALLYTGALEATNPRDYIYGILGITNFPSKAMSLQDWMGARHEETFIPIDYSLDLSSLLSIVTWALLMEGGLGILARFKAFADEPDDTVEKALPSWVIDWRLASRLFTRIKGTYTPPFGDPSPFVYDPQLNRRTALFWRGLVQDSDTL